MQRGVTRVTFGAEPILGQLRHPMPFVLKCIHMLRTTILRCLGVWRVWHHHALLGARLVAVQACFTSLPSGNQDDGLPPVAHTGAGVIGPSFDR